MRSSRAGVLTAALALALVWMPAAPGALHAQSTGASDVELLGRVYGTTPPDAFYRLLAEDPSAFRFRRAWTSRREHAADQRRSALGRGGLLSTSYNPLAAAASGAGSVAGDVAFPVVLGHFADSPAQPPHAAAAVRSELFDGPNSHGMTIPEFYDELSGGRVRLEGVVTPWIRSGITQGEVAGGSSGIGGSSKVGAFIIQLLEALDADGFDWSRFDNDGPDGIPNSGDDDGYVDVLAVIHPTRGAECGDGLHSDRIWSHRWNLEGATGEAFVTRTRRPDGSYIRVNDFTVQPVLSCDNSNINEIGVFAHELGHGFGLPDLYSTSATAHHGGAGAWDLMASGSWGCRGGEPERPCHMGAWSKATLGWLDVEVLAPDLDHGVLSLPPVQTTGRAWEVRSADGSGEYFLLENRQRLGSDANLPGPGLLVWHIDPAVVNQRWESNTINNDPSRMGVWLRQADGLDRLASSTGGRGDAGDPFPGSTGNRAFHASSSPASRSHLGSPTGMTLLDIRAAGESMELRLLTRFQELTLRAEDAEGAGNGEGGTPELTVDGQRFPGTEVVFHSAPWQEHTITAELPVADGVRAGVEWEDGTTGSRVFSTRLSDSLLVAGFEGTEFRVDVAFEGAPEDVIPATLRFTGRSDGGWVAAGAETTLEAVPNTGFSFLEWTGALSGQPNPATFVVDEPVRAGAAFEQTYRLSGAPTVGVEAAAPQEIVFETRNANLPVVWSVEGALPDGLVFRPGVGDIRGAALELGTFPVTITARDAIGLEGEIEVELTVTPPVIGVDVLIHFLQEDGRGPTPAQRFYLDAHGNGNGVYDLGDLRAFMIAHPELPMTMEDAPATPSPIVLPELRRAGEP